MISSTNPMMMTAQNDYRYNECAMDNGDKYDHCRAFRAASLPKIMMPDPYPIRPDYDWNSSSLNPSAYQSHSIQYALNNRLLKKYNDARAYSAGNDNKFIPIPQIFGQWGSSS